MGNTLRSVLIGKIDEWPEKLGKTVNIGKIQLAVFKLESGEIRAIENRCPHKGGVLAEGIVTGEYVFCPMHDWKINVLDGKVQEPDIGCVKTFPVEVKENQVYVLLDR
ncbi:nitrite reductase small subunit NirD [Mesobacillus maritimus]|uniref:nitrite reductase small subunit NirD n=1 Tax=Mesobacillus maritimus TaxID=1643336 RepID=UPI00203DFDE0|nr:nitrite reductase small subunit NirD [Mesobacillus maritimus]MCM3670754.1 nitrite reductase small subunit NirD [Mesobacillus maritimus]